MSSQSPEDRLSGPDWLRGLAEYTDYERLESDFREKVLEFKAALADARVVPDDVDLSSVDLKTLDTRNYARAAIEPKVWSTLRSRERAYLIHWSWLIYHQMLENEALNPPGVGGQGMRLHHELLEWLASAPDQTSEGWAVRLRDWNASLPARLIEAIPKFEPKSGESDLDIQWLHRTKDGAPDVAASMSAALALYNAANVRSRLTGPPSAESRHTEGKAIDWSFTWSASRLLMRKKSGVAVVITSTPHDESNRDMIEVAASYGVIYLKVDYGDRGHFSSDGK